MDTIFTARDGRDIHVREAQGDDAAMVIEYIETIAGETDYLTFGKGEFGISETEEYEILEKAHDAPNVLYILAFLDNTLCGALDFSCGKRPRMRHTGHFGISVLKSFWDLGVASALIDTLVDWSRASGVTKINLEVREDNHRAIDLYKRKGFVEEGRISKAMYVGGVYYVNIAMGVDLDKI